MQHPPDMHHPAKLFNTCKSNAGNGIGAPRHIAEQEWIKSLKAQQRITAVQRAMNNRIVALQSLPGFAQQISGYFRAVRADQQNLLSLIQSALRSPRQPYAEIAFPLI